jgi:uncharacterized membrane protein YeaQ/YmgE (transglycosylase-associated protein family)
MGNYRQHLTFAAVLGAIYSAVACFGAGIHWLYATVAALFTTMSGLLPDLDSDSGVEMKTFTGVLGVLVAVAVWRRLAHVEPEPAFEYHLWAVVGAYVIVRHGVRRITARLTVHRGMSHSIPTCVIWGELMYLYYPAESHTLRMFMAIAVMLGFFSHLLLDEICSVDLKGVRVNKAFGTAMKFWSSSIVPTVVIYGILSFFSWRVIQVWPENPLAFETPEKPAALPLKVPDNVARAEGEVRTWVSNKWKKSDTPDATSQSRTR